MVLTCFNPSNKIVISTNHPKYGWTTTILWTQLEHMVAMVARNGICSQMTGHFVKSINGGFLNKMGLIIPKSSISMDFSITNHPFGGTPIYGNLQLNNGIHHSGFILSALLVLVSWAKWGLCHFAPGVQTKKTGIYGYSSFFFSQS